jgi:hypothetical protein
LKERRFFLFSYNECKIISAAPLAEIRAYLRELGAGEMPGPVYEYAGLKIEITSENNALINLNIPRHTIHVHGDRALAERLLTDFRFRFLSAGG